jgi:hypothetical protein
MSDFHDHVLIDELLVDCLGTGEAEQKGAASKMGKTNKRRQSGTRIRLRLEDLGACRRTPRG